MLFLKTILTTIFVWICDISRKFYISWGIYLLAWVRLVYIIPAKVHKLNNDFYDFRGLYFFLFSFYFCRKSFSGSLLCKHVLYWIQIMFWIKLNYVYLVLLAGKINKFSSSYLINPHRIIIQHFKQNRYSLWFRL